MRRSGSSRFRDGQSDRKPYYRAVRLHRGGAAGGRTAEDGAARRRYRAPAPGADYRGSDGDCTDSAGSPRRPAVGAAVLPPDRRPDSGDLRDGPEAGQVGKGDGVESIRLRLDFTRVMEILRLANAAIPRRIFCRVSPLEAWYTCS